MPHSKNLALQERDDGPSNSRQQLLEIASMSPALRISHVVTRDCIDIALASVPKPMLRSAMQVTLTEMFENRGPNFQQLRGALASAHLG